MFSARVSLFLILYNNYNFSSQNAAISDGKEDLSELPPNQRRKKLASKVEELKNKIAQETAARDGLMKMKGVYEANPALGDPRSVESECL